MAVEVDYSLELARKHVNSYGQHTAMKCGDFLRHGIEAYRWLRQADHTVRQAAREGLEVSPETVSVLSELYRLWCRPCSHAEKLIAEQEARGLSVAGVKEFREARDFAEGQIRRLEMYETLEQAFRGEFFDDSFWTEAGGLRSP